MSPFDESHGREEPEVDAEAGRYIETPGQVLAYMVGRIEIMRARRAAEARMGSRVDIRAFHDLVLEHGPGPSGHARRSCDSVVVMSRSQTRCSRRPWTGEPIHAALVGLPGWDDRMEDLSVEGEQALRARFADILRRTET